MLIVSEVRPVTRKTTTVQDLVPELTAVDMEIVKKAAMEVAQAVAITKAEYTVIAKMVMFR